MKSTKKALFTSVISLLLCVSMLVGTTFAWFTDSVTSGINQIIAGNLDVELYRENAHILKTKVTGETSNLFKDVTLWEPGAYAYETFTVENAGTLALKYKMNLNVAAANNFDGHDLSEVIKVAVSETVPANRAAAAALPEYTTLDSWALNGSEILYPAGGAEPSEKTFTVVLYWEPTDNDNLFNMNNGKETTDRNPLEITIGVNLFATQVEHEVDSFGNDYDADTALPADIVAKGVLKVTMEPDSNENYAPITNEEQVIADAETDPAMSVSYPVGVKLNDSASIYAGQDGTTATVQQKFEYKSDTASSAMSNVTIADGKSVASYELTLPVAEDNSVPVTVTVKYTPNLTGVQIYHNGALLPANGESAVYNPAGSLTLTLKHASPIDIVFDAVACTHKNHGDVTMTAAVHSYVCSDCGETVSKAHSYVDGICACGYKSDELLLTENSAYTCRIGNTGYVRPFSENTSAGKNSALKNAKSGDTITMIANYESVNDYYADQKNNDCQITIDLNSKSITMKNTFQPSQGIYNIVDSSEAKAGIINKVSLYNYQQDSYNTTLNVYAGTISKISTAVPGSYNVNIYGGNIDLIELQDMAKGVNCNIVGGTVSYVAVYNDMTVGNVVTLAPNYSIGNEVNNEIKLNYYGSQFMANAYLMYPVAIQ